MQPIAIIVIALLGAIAGGLILLGYMLWRMMRNDGWDDSNINNAERLLSHVVLHPEDFGKMYYLSYDQATRVATTAAYDEEPLRRPFWYVDKDEFSEVVNTRP